MAEPRPPVPVLLVAAVFSRHADALAWAQDRLEEAYGPVDGASPAFVFHQTAYYAAAMGGDLRKQFFAFRDLIAPDRLADVKLHTNALERELADAGALPEAAARQPRPRLSHAWASSCWPPPRTRRTASTCATASSPR